MGYTIRKYPIFFILLFSIQFLIVCNISENVSAKEITTYQNNTQYDGFKYNIQTPLVNNSYANRIATENFEYEENFDYTDNLLSKTTNIALVKSFNDIDFGFTNNTYKSKGLLLKRNNTGASTNCIKRYFTNEYDFENIRTRNIFRIDNSTQFFLRFYFSSTTYISFQFTYATRQMIVVLNGATIKTFINFLPTSGSYQYLYINYERLSISLNYDAKINYIAYNQNGLIVGQNNTQNFDVNTYRYTNLYSVAMFYYLPAINTQVFVVAEDLNCFTERMVSNQYAQTNFEYRAWDIQTFYLTKVPVYTSNTFRNTTTSNTYYYATTILQNRYLRYLTNATKTYQSNLLTDNFNTICKNSFLTTFELGTNTTSGIGNANSINIYFNSTYFTVRITVLPSLSYRLYLIKTKSSTLTYIFYKDFTSFTDLRIIFNMQFKNKIVYSSFLVNQQIYSFENYLDESFSNITSSFPILNSEIKSLNTNSVMKYSNQTINLYSDTLSFKDRVQVLSIYATFSSVIRILPNTITQVMDLNNVVYNIKNSKIISMNFNIKRSSENGYFSITSDFEYTLSLFNGTKDKTDIIDYNFLIDKDSGYIYLNSRFWTTSESQIFLNVTTSYTRLLSFTDQIPANNLLINKVFEILLPLLIFGMLIIGFKTNSDSKYIGFIGMYIALFTFYLLEYMSLLFMILCMLIQTIGLYFIIKNEKNEGI